jgi:hypothetical protein
MKLYSSTLISWPKILHISQAARLYPGRWQNNYIYRIDGVEPLELTTYSPIGLLQENRKFYCYDRYNRDKRFETLGASYSFGDFSLYIPEFAQKGDVVIIKDENFHEGFPKLA